MGPHIYKQVILISVFMLMTPLTLAISIFALTSVSVDSSTHVQKNQLNQNVNQNNLGVHIYAALPDTLPSISIEVDQNDARAEIIHQYLAKYDSPLLGHEHKIVKAADENDIDFRLITAIAQQESNLCKKIPPDTYNCWGWGIHSQGTLGFQSFDEGIDIVSKGLKENYIDQGYLTPEIIMTKYTPLSNGSWAEGVSFFMSEML